MHTLCSDCCTMVLYAFLLLLGISLTGGMESGIIGGKEAKPHSRPYMASIQINKRHTCGGMLIREDYVLTTAHCLKSNQGKFEVLLGAHNIHKEEKSQQRIPVKKNIQHPKFLHNNEDYSYDIMLLKLQRNATLNKFVKVLPLPKKNGKIPANVKCSISGWGSKTATDVKESNVMQEVTLKLQFDFECKHKWQKYFNAERMICSVSDGKHAFCQGDSGSPLICNTKAQAIASYTYSGNCVKKTHSTFCGRDHFEVVLGAHNIRKLDKSQQKIPVKNTSNILFLRNNERDYGYDIMLQKGSCRVHVLVGRCSFGPHTGPTVCQAGGQNVLAYQ